jgi:hypothetical protein
VKRRYPIIAVLVMALAMVATVAFAGNGGPRTGLISRTSGGAAGAGGSSGVPIITPGGRFVTFNSTATNLPGSINPDTQAYVRNRRTGTTALVSRTSGGDPAMGGDSFDTAVSASGRYVAFESIATNLPGSLAPEFFQVYVRDRKTGRTRLVSRTTSGDAATGGDSVDASISGSGRFVLFESDAANLPGSGFQVYLRDLERHRTTLVSKTTGGVTGNGDSFDPSISRNGRFLGFESESTNFPGGLGAPDAQVYLRNRRQGNLILVSRNTGGSPGNDDSHDLMVSSRGRYVGFESIATNLPGSLGPTYYQVYLRDRERERTVLVSRTNAGDPAAGGTSEDASVSDSGRFVAFESQATNLGGVTTGIEQVFVRDRRADRTRLASRANDGSPADDDSTLAFSATVLTADGRFVVFTSFGSNLPGSLGPTYSQAYIRGPVP